MKFLNFIEYTVYVIVGIFLIFQVIKFLKSLMRLNKSTTEWNKQKEQEVQKILDEYKDIEVPKGMDSEGFLSEISSNCKQCGAALPLIQNGRVIAHCPYCGAAIENARELISKAFEMSQIQQQHNNRMEEINTQLDSIKQTHRSETRSILIKILAIFGIPFLIILIIILAVHTIRR